MQGVAAKNDASYDLSRARASVAGQTTIAAYCDDVPAERPYRDGPLCGVLIWSLCSLAGALGGNMHPQSARHQGPDGGRTMATT